MDVVKFILNILSAPIKLLLLFPLSILVMLMAFAGYGDEAFDLFGVVIFNKWFD